MTNTLREEIRPIISQRYHETSDNRVLDRIIDDILKLFEKHGYISKEELEKRIDKVEQRAIEYIICKDEGDPTATRELADIMNDHSTENCWRGMKIIIQDFRGILK